MNKYRRYYIAILTFILFLVVFIKYYFNDDNSFTITTNNYYSCRTATNKQLDNSSSLFPTPLTLKNIILHSTITRNLTLTIGIYIALKSQRDLIDYAFAISTIRCYAQLHNYRLHIDYVDDLIEQKCPQNDFFFKRHCMAALALPHYTWMLFIDADIGVVNPYHLIVEFIDNRVNIIFYDRLYNWEIVAGSYLIRNSPYSIDLLNEFANVNYALPKSLHGTDNGAIHLTPHAVKKYLFCQKIWSLSRNDDDLFTYEACARSILGENRIWPGEVKILDRCDGWARDGWITQGTWSSQDFMIHGWKTKTLNGADAMSMWKMPLRESLIGKNCTNGIVNVWNYDTSLFDTDLVVRGKLADYERTVIKKFWQSLARVDKYL